MTQLSIQLEALLLEHFGYPHFRPGQLEIIEAVCTGRDVLAILPTGGGKSLCFQIPGLYLGGSVLIISPLISLMQDQVTNLQKRNLRATFINSTLTSQERARRLEKFKRGEYQFVYTAPETLSSNSFQAQCRQSPISAIAIDEAHCVSVWGHDFRPHYLQIGRILQQIFPDTRPPIIALTATANHQAQRDIVRFCGLRQPLHSQQSFARDNLKIMVNHCFNEHDKLLKILWVLQQHQGEIGIIYVLTRRQAVFIADKLNALLRPEKLIKVYHGGLDKDARAQIQEEFIAGVTPVIVATNAFGMGVDQPHVRFVIHAQISSNLENYFQEIGRGGRDGQLARCYAFYTHKDLEISLQFIKGNHTLTPQRQKILFQKLVQVQKFLECRTCRQRFVLAYFDERRPGFECGLCDNCLGYHFHYPQKVKQNLHQWQQWRQLQARRQKLIPSTIITDLTLSYLSIIPWQKLPDLQVIPGLGRGFVEHYSQFLPDGKVGSE
ncbi:RecQ family ATP-dependent DNA helicase [bacterium]|nr:RecQ family ATP-dependent DNA helicase [bacterium]